MTLRRTGVTAVHSVERIVFTVPDIEPAQKFYTAFGMDVKCPDSTVGPRVDLYTHGHPHCWMSVVANGQPKALQYISFGIYAEDEAAFKQKIEASGLGCAPNPMAAAVGGKTSGLWLRSPDGVTLHLVVADKVSPNRKTPKSTPRGLPRKDASAPMRSQSSQVQPRWLSHVLLFSPDVSRMVEFGENVLGLRLSDRSGGLVAFMHTPHGSDHHLLAFVQSSAAGLHHTSWDVGSLDEVGEGSEQLRAAGYPDGWGVGRHVLGSNYFYYARDPWGSFAEYSFDIDFVPATTDWIAGDFPPEDSFYLWGPAVPEWFVANTEAPAVETAVAAAG
jgi:catechol 2,3-dioxygenase-like lactoylglutathione lyase family enzyme